MSYKAIDVVLLPDEKMTDFVIEANAELMQKFGSEIILNSKDCLPHISLVMGCIKEEDIADAGRSLASLKPITPKSLMPVSIQRNQSSSGKIDSVIQIKRTDKLQKLHEKVCIAIQKYLHYDVTEDMIAGGHASESTLEWIKSFPVKSSYSNYSPHITIGYGDLTERPLQEKFKVSRLAICHLGNHCTCRKILWTVEI